MLMPRKKTTSQFITEAKKVHGDRYDYSLTKYVGAIDKLEIVCLIHGSFKQSASVHLRGSGCPSCASDSQSGKNDFLKKARATHGLKYFYSKVVYKTSGTPVDIICETHGLFSQRPYNHLLGQGCPKCGKIRMANVHRKPIDKFLEEARKVHGNKYNYNDVVYKSGHGKVKISCKEHGPFLQIAKNHIGGQGCPTCGGTKRMTTEEFVTKAKDIHGDRYDYSSVTYKNGKGNVKIGCKKHGFFIQSANSHLTGRGCRECGYEKNAREASYDTESFIKKAIDKHGDKYGYSLVRYKSSQDKVKIYCPQHGYFLQKPTNHLLGQGCRKCSFEKARKDTSVFIKRAEGIHDNKYDYSKSVYKTIKSRVIIGCKIHGNFIQTAQCHLSGRGCPSCAKVLPYTNETFAGKASEIHGNKYDYSMVNYKTFQAKVKIVCPEHGVFSQSPSTHLRGSGCPTCSLSWGEKKIASFLEANDINFQPQKKFTECRYRAVLRFDFFISELSTLIEYDGMQHFQAVDFFGGEKALKVVQKRDRIKAEFAKQHGYNLLRIKYTDFDRIEEILSEALNLKEEAA